MTKISPNANYYFLGGASVHNVASREYKEYRKCWDEYPKNFFLREFPMHIDIEVSSRCNLKCTFCDKLPVLPKSKIGDIDLGLYKKIIDECSQNGLWGLKLSYRGEPLLHKDIAEMVAYAKQKGILDVYFNTNGMLLDEKMSKKLINAGLDRLSVSVEGTDKDFFEKNRIGARFDTILNNIDALLELRKTKNIEYPKVRVQTILFEGIDLDKYKAFWGKHADEVAAIDYKEGTKRTKGIVYDWGCPQLWQRLTIEWDGTVHPCNNDDSAFFVLGNAKDRSIAEFWHDERVAQARLLHASGQSHKVAACDGCPWRTAQIQKLKQ